MTHLDRHAKQELFTLGIAKGDIKRPLGLSERVNRLLDLVTQSFTDRSELGVPKSRQSMYFQLVQIWPCSL